jgi:N-acetylglucosaminyl-diphospho-decaprenol L-rhamnosyltransferase
MSARIHVIIVSHNSDRVLPLCLKYLENQILFPDSCTVVDSGSTNISSLRQVIASASLPVTLIEAANCGFGAANNIGYRNLKICGDDLVAFINPDTFVAAHVFSESARFLRSHSRVGVLSGKLLGFELDSGRPSGKIDSTGIFRRWFGRWYDRGAGEKDLGQYEQASDVPAICGALMICRASCLLELGDTIFDEDFFLYKEDIELSLRIRKLGWRLYYMPSVTAYHCRGWAESRGDMAYRLRLMSAKNELRLYLKHPSPYMLWAIAKYLLVRLFRL